jgi:hypothetical protein
LRPFMAMTRRYGTRKLATATLVIVGLSVLPAGAVESGKADSSPACTHGLSSLGPVLFRDGQVVGGSTTPTTEACLP